MTFVVSWARGLPLPTPHLLQRQHEEIGSQRWDEGIEGSGNHSQTTGEKTPCCPERLLRFAGSVRDGTTFFEERGDLGGSARGKALLCAQKQLCMFPVLVTLQDINDLNSRFSATLPLNLERSFKWKIL